MQTANKPSTNSLTVTGSELIATIEHVIHEGNVRKVTVKQNGTTNAEFPLTVGVLGAAVAPALAAMSTPAATPARRIA